uniref:Uncharacterized protein n=1 Tax=Zea mays TaxID=4577 RepID=C4J6X7_MAIZE|nr:unknown [Zea mays]
MIGRRHEAHQAGTTTSCLKGLHCCPHAAASPVNMGSIWLKILRQHRRQCSLGLVDAEIGKVAVGPPSINHRVRIDAGSKGRLRLTESHKSVSLGSAGVLVGDDDGLKYVAELLEVGPHAVLVRLPREAPHEHLGQRRVAELPRTAAAGHHRRRLMRHIYIFVCIQQQVRRTDETDLFLFHFLFFFFCCTP